MKDTIMDLNTKNQTTDPELEKPVNAIAGRDYFMIGSDDRPTDDRVVAISVAVRADLKVGDREFSAPLCLHEVPVIRQFYEGKGGGSIRLTPGWLPGLSRNRKLTQTELTAEARRLSNTFVLTRHGAPPVQCFNTFYGSAPQEQIQKLHAVMREQYEAWNNLLSKARMRLTEEQKTLHPEIQNSMACDLITERDLDELAGLADPSRKGLDTIALPEVTEIPETIAPPAKGATLADIEKLAEEADIPDALDIRIKKLRTAGCSERQANEAATLLEMVGGPAKVTREDLVKVVGTKLADSPAVQAALKE